VDRDKEATVEEEQPDAEGNEENEEDGNDDGEEEEKGEDEEEEEEQIPRVVVVRIVAQMPESGKPPDRRKQLETISKDLEKLEVDNFDGPTIKVGVTPLTEDCPKISDQGRCEELDTKCAWMNDRCEEICCEKVVGVDEETWVRRSWSIKDAEEEGFERFETSGKLGLRGGDWHVQDFKGNGGLSKVTTISGEFTPKLVVDWTTKPESEGNIVIKHQCKGKDIDESIKPAQVKSGEFSQSSKCDVGKNHFQLRFVYVTMTLKPLSLTEIVSALKDARRSKDLSKKDHEKGKNHVWNNAEDPYLGEYHTEGRSVFNEETRRCEDSVFAQVVTGRMLGKDVLQAFYDAVKAKGEEDFYNSLVEPEEKKKDVVPEGKKKRLGRFDQRGFGSIRNQSGKEGCATTQLRKSEETDGRANCIGCVQGLGKIHGQNFQAAAG